MSLDHLSDDARQALDDACLSALMEEYLGIEGARLEGETMRLNGDETFQYPAELDSRCLEEFEDHFKKERRRARLDRLRRFGNAAAAVLALAALGWAAAASARPPERLAGAGALAGGAFAGSFSVLFPIAFVLAAGMFVVLALRGIAAWSRNNAAPRLTVEALIVAKREDVSHSLRAGAGDYAGAHGYHGAISTDYYVTFEVASGDRMEFSLPGADYGLLSEGDFGRLSFQGTRYLGFARE